MHSETGRVEVGGKAELRKDFGGTTLAGHSDYDDAPEDQLFVPRSISLVRTRLILP